MAGAQTPWLRVGDPRGKGRVESIQVERDVERCSPFGTLWPAGLPRAHVHDLDVMAVGSLADVAACGAGGYGGRTGGAVLQRKLWLLRHEGVSVALENGLR